MRLTDWHLMDKETVEANLLTDLYRGLSEKEAARRRKKNGGNRIWQVRRASATGYARDAVSDLTTVLLIMCAVLAAILEGSASALAVCVILFIGISLRVATFVRAKRIFEMMADEGIPNATVLRDSATRVIKADGLVRGDVIILGEGDVVPCDGRIISDGEVRVSERGITENRSSVIKRDTVIVTDVEGSEIPCEYRVNMLFAGSVILSGSCRLVVTSCSEESLVCMKKGGIVVPSGETLPTIEKYEKISGLCNLLLIALILVVSVISIPVRGAGRIADVFFSMLSLAAASMSTYLGAVGYIIVAVPVRDAAKGVNGAGKAVIKDCSFIEDIASPDRFVVSDVSVFKSGAVSLSSYWTAGKSYKRGEGEPDRLLGMLAASVCSVDKSDGVVSVSEHSDNAKKLTVDRLIADAEKAYGRDAADRLKVIDRAPGKEEGAVIDTVVALRGNSVEAIVSGPLLPVLVMCDRYTSRDGTEFMTDRVREDLIRLSKEASDRGERVFAVASRHSPYTYIKHATLLHSRMRFEGFVTVSEEAADGMLDSLKTMRKLGVNLTLLTSEPEQDAAYLVSRGFLESGAETIPCGDFMRMENAPKGDYVLTVPTYSDPEMKRTAVSDARCSAVGKIVKSGERVCVITKEALDSRMMNGQTVGAAVSPSERRPIPQTLKRRGKITVYPHAAEGCGGLRETCEAVFSSFRALYNLSDALLYVITSQTARIVAALTAALSGVGLTTPVGILILGLVFDFLAVLTLAFRGEPKLTVAARGMGTPAKSIAVAALTGVIAGTACSFLPFAGVIRMGGDIIGRTGVVSASVNSMILVQFASLTAVFINSRKKRGAPARAYFLYALTVAAAFAAVSLFSPVWILFGDTRPHPLMIAFSVVPAVIAFLVSRISSYFMKKKPDGKGKDLNAENDFS